jgi:7-cyano-7-deazaguanine synthase
MNSSVVLLSGGLDSATVAAKALAEGEDVTALSINYGQKNARELQCAARLVEIFGIRNHFAVNVNLALWCRTELTGKEDDADAGATGQGAPSSGSYVPGRNTVLIAIALSLAEARKADAIYVGFNAADTLYSDTSARFLRAFGQFSSAFSDFDVKLPRLIAPLIDKDKVGVVRAALELGVPIDETWSCFRAGESHCGLCGACRTRDFALIKAGRPELATPEGRASYAGGVERATRYFWRFALRDEVADSSRTELPGF